MVFEKTLEECGYRRGGHPSGFYRNDWLKPPGFHIILRPSSRKIVLNIKYDPPHHIGSSRTWGDDLEGEIEGLIRTYRGRLKNR